MGNFQITRIATSFHAKATLEAGASAEVEIDISSVGYDSTKEKMLTIVRQTRACIGYVKETTQNKIVVVVENPHSQTMNCYLYLLLLFYKYK